MPPLTDEGLTTQIEPNLSKKRRLTIGTILTAPKFMDPLKQQFYEKSQALAKEVKGLLKEHGDKKVDELYRTMIETAFNEDKLIVEAQQKLIERDPASAVFTNFAFDRAGQSARRILKRLMAVENEGAGKLEAAE